MINAERALRNGISVDQLQWLHDHADEAPWGPCPDCVSVEIPYLYAGHGLSVLQEHDDLCPRWTAAAAGGVDEQTFLARMNDPYLFLKQTVKQ
jgi:hypothetical protein